MKHFMFYMVSDQKYMSNLQQIRFLNIRCFHSCIFSRCQVNVELFVKKFTEDSVSVIVFSFQTLHMIFKVKNFETSFYSIPKSPEWITCPHDNSLHPRILPIPKKETQIQIGQYTLYTDIYIYIYIPQDFRSIIFMLLHHL